MFGPNQHLHLAIEDMFKELKDLSENITEEEFNRALQSELHDYYTIISMRVQEYYTGDLLESIIRSEYPSCHDIYHIAKSMRLFDMRNLCQQFFKQMKILALIQGNLTAEEAKSIMRTVETSLSCGKMEKVSLHSKCSGVNKRNVVVYIFWHNLQRPTRGSTALRLPVGGSCLLVDAFSRKRSQTATKNYYQIGPASIRTRLLLEFLTGRNSLFRKPPRPFHANCHISWDLLEYDGILGYSIAVNSEEEDTPIEIVDNLIEEVRNETMSLIENMSDEQFQSQMSFLAEEHHIENDFDLNAEVYRNDSEIVKREYLFDRHKRTIEILHSLSRAEVVQFYRDHLAAEERTLSIKVIGYTKETGLESWKTMSGEIGEGRLRELPANVLYAESRTMTAGKLIRNIDEFKKSLDGYRQSN